MAITKYWKSITATATGLMSIIGVLTFLEISIPRPAWASELREIAEYLVDVDSRVTSQQLDEARLQLYRNIRERSGYERRDEEIPDFLTQERVILERRIENLQEHLDFLRETASE